MWLSLHVISAKESITEIVQRNDRAEIFPRRAQKMFPPRIGTWHPVIDGSANGVASEINFSPGRTWIQRSPGFLIRIPNAASTRSPMRATPATGSSKITKEKAAPRSAVTMNMSARRSTAAISET
jgi:hypothetical protein